MATLRSLAIVGALPFKRVLLAPTKSTQLVVGPTRSVASKPEIIPEKPFLLRFKTLSVITVVCSFTFFGASLSKSIAGFLEETEIFINEEDDDDDD